MTHDSLLDTEKNTIRLKQGVIQGNFHQLDFQKLRTWKQCCWVFFRIVRLK